MTHHITEKITQTEELLTKVVEEHNKLAERKQELLNQATELNGALKALRELNHDHGDQATDSDAS